MSKILVTGSTGFIGKRLILDLLREGHQVYALSRIRGVRFGPENTNGLHWLYGDLKDPAHLDPIPKEIDAAYYLVHSMAEDIKNLQQEEEIVARNFVRVIDASNCKQIIYLGGILDETRPLSPHLASRKRVENVLREAKAPVTVLRASIIIGPGSASFQIIRDLVETLPFMITPKWVNTLCRPICLQDVLFYLTGSLLQESMYGGVYNIGGPDVMSFKEVLLRYAKFRKLKRWVVGVPVLTPKLSAYWLVFITSVRFSLCSYLVESMKCSSTFSEDRIGEILPHSCLPLEETFRKVLEETDHKHLTSTWMDSWVVHETGPDIDNFLQIPEKNCLRDIRKVALKVPEKEAIRRIWSIGGKTGWYGSDWAWRLRGFIDQMFGGTGMNLGRRDPEEILVGDSIDFWRVVKADREHGRLVMYAEMKLPGKAWLEFRIDNGYLQQTATFVPEGILGRLYWYILIPIHNLIFPVMAKNIAQGKMRRKEESKELEYGISESSENFSLRNYPEYCVAETVVSGERKTAIREGFLRLSRYIFGNNELQETLPMRIPVMQQKGKDGWIIRFVLPSSSDIPLPNPSDSSITFRNMQLGSVAALRFSGTPSEGEIEEKIIILREMIRIQGKKPISEPILAFYDSPRVPDKLRRYEILYQIE